MLANKGQMGLTSSAIAFCIFRHHQYHLQCDLDLAEHSEEPNAPCEEKGSNDDDGGNEEAYKIQQKWNSRVEGAMAAIKNEFAG